MPSPEVVPRLIRQIYQVRPDLKLPEAAIHAVLFEVRRALPRDNPGRERLPFYWYTHGPYSEIVRSSIEDLERRGILREETKAGKTLLVLDARPAAVGCVCEDELWRIVREIDPLEAFINRIYRDHAPYEFMPRYRVDFIASLEGYIASRPEGTLDRGSTAWKTLSTRVRPCSWKNPSSRGSTTSLPRTSLGPGRLLILPERANRPRTRPSGRHVRSPGMSGACLPAGCAY